VVGGLTPGPDGEYYGLLSCFGANLDQGGSYSVSPTRGFNSLEISDLGTLPVGELSLGSDGNLYGVYDVQQTPNFSGEIFGLFGAPLTPLHPFTDGTEPVGGIIQASDGRFYGLTAGTASVQGTVYKLALSPFAPTNVTATGGPGSATLSWTGTNTANTYTVYESTSPPGEFQTLTAVQSGITGTSVTITGLTNGTTYYFAVSGTNEAGTGAPSDQVSAQPKAAPSALTDVAANGQITLTWTAAPGASSYDIYEGASAGGEASSPVKTGITGTSAVITGLTNGKAYFFRVAAVYSAAVGPESNEIVATPTGASSSGGGALDELSIWMLAMLAVARRLRPTRGLSRASCFNANAESPCATSRRR
jgi:hypothetical protein